MEQSAVHNRFKTEDWRLKTANADASFNQGDFFF
jgi:hypothetical protein